MSMEDLPDSKILFELLDSEIIKLPKSYKGDFIEFIKRTNNEYLCKVYSLKGNGAIIVKLKENFDLIKEIGEKTVEALELKLNGFPHEAYRIIKKMLDKDKDYFPSLIAKGDGNGIDASHFPHLYRIRSSDKVITNKEDMFHIPFNLRELVSDQRYSIAGYPSLYLATSIYTAWKELREPPIKSIYVSRFRFKPMKKINLLDFGHTPDYEKKGYSIFNNQGISKDFTNWLVARLIYWPLIMASSIKVSNSNKNFKEEYIIPQLMFQYIRETESIDGIRYFSTHYKQDKHSLQLGSNLVFPTSKDTGKNYCEELVSKFDVSNPINIIDVDSSTVTNNLKKLSSDIYYIIPLIEYFDNKQYKDTILGKVQLFMENIKTSEINNLWRV